MLQNHALFQDMPALVWSWGKLEPVLRCIVVKQGITAAIKLFLSFLIAC